MLLNFKKHFTKETLMAFENLLKMTIDDLHCILDVKHQRIRMGSIIEKKILYF